jgi:hypothetical protein
MFSRIEQLVVLFAKESLPKKFRKYVTVMWHDDKEVESDIVDSGFDASAMMMIPTGT